MSRSLVIAFSGKIINPSKMELISLSNLIWYNRQMQETAVNYMFTDNGKIISATAISKCSYNTQLMNKLSCMDYNKEPFDMNAEIKKLF